MAKQELQTITVQEKRTLFVKACICELLGWSEQQYADTQYQNGLEYLRLYIPNDPEGADLLSRSRIFWQWWLNHWVNRDASFISLGVQAAWGNPLSKKEYDLIDKRQLYLAEHDPAQLVSAIYPHRVVLDQSYAEMIWRLFDAQNIAQ